MNFAPPYHFLWDDDKAETNERRHKVSFDEAAVAFRDPLSTTWHDTEHSVVEDRWITIGRTRGGTLVAVVHTCEEHDGGGLNVRLISARKATPWERRGYETGDYAIREPDVTLENQAMNGDSDFDELPRDFDFSKAERGKFYSKDAVYHYPVYLDPEVLEYFSRRAFEVSLGLAPLLNEVLKREMARIRAGS